MTAVHVVVGVALLVVNAAAVAWGGWRWWRGTPDGTFWRLLRGGQALCVVEAALGGVLLLLGREPGRELHVLYGTLPIAVFFVAEQLRLAAADTVLGRLGYDSVDELRARPEAEHEEVALGIARRELAVMALAAAVVVLLAARAAFWSPPVP